MDAPPPPPPLPPPLQIETFLEEPTSQKGAVMESSTSPSQFHTDSSMSITTDGGSATKAITLRKTKKKQKNLNPHAKHTSSSPSSSDFSCSTASSSQSLPRRRGIRLFGSRRNRKVIPEPGRSKQGDIGALALPLGMSIAAVVAQVWVVCSFWMCICVWFCDEDLIFSGKVFFFGNGKTKLLGLFEYLLSLLIYFCIVEKFLNFCGTLGFFC